MAPLLRMLPSIDVVGALLALYRALLLLLVGVELATLKVAELLLDVSDPNRPASEMNVAELFDRFSENVGTKRI